MTLRLWRCFKWPPMDYIDASGLPNSSSESLCPKVFREYAVKNVTDERCLGDHDEHEKEPDELCPAVTRGLGPDHVHDHKLDLDNGEECQHGVHGLEAKEKGCHRAVDHLPPHHPPAPHHLCNHLL